MWAGKKTESEVRKAEPSQGGLTTFVGLEQRLPRPLAQLSMASLVKEVSIQVRPAVWLPLFV